MLEQKIARVERLLKALDDADGQEDFIIHRTSALELVKSDIEHHNAGAELVIEEITKEELAMVLKTLEAGPASFKRKTSAEIASILVSVAKAALPIHVESLNGEAIGAHAEA